MNKIIFLTVFLSSLSIFSQNGTPTAQEQERMQEQMEKNRKENLAQLMAELTSTLNLNALQTIAIEQIYTESSKKHGIILKKEISEEDKIAALKSLSESTEKKVLDLLDVQQKQLFEEMKIDRSLGKKKDKKKKKESKQ